jgi:hypothetical protein
MIYKSQLGERLKNEENLAEEYIRKDKFVTSFFVILIPAIRRRSLSLCLVTKKFKHVNKYILNELPEP